MPKIHFDWNVSREKIKKFLASNTFFAAIVAWFVVQASWIAFSGLYPMAFDEDTHLGSIRFFASHPNPFFTHQPAYLNQYGPIVRDPSYLYRYLMSFPWRLITLVTGNFMAQVIAMRLINVALFAVSLVLMRKLLLKLTNSKLLVNATLLLFTLVPITSQLAAQINYDNLMILLMISSLLIAIKITSKLKANKLDIWLLTWFVVLATAASLVKYTYLPILITILIYLAWHFKKNRTHKKSSYGQMLKQNFSMLSKIQFVIIACILILCTGLMAERYGVNLLKYRNITPSCTKVLDVSACQQSSIYQRGIIYANSKPPVINKNPLLFTYRWAKHMNYNLMMNLSGPAIGYSVGQPLPLPYTASIIFGVIGLLLLIVFNRRIFNNSTKLLILAAIILYCVFLWMANYTAYLSTGRRVAIQGRYLVPLLPFLYLFFLQAIKQLFIKVRYITASLITILILCFAAGGGVMTFILHSDNTWYWPNATVITFNNDAKNALHYIVPGWGTRYKPYWQSSFSF